MSTNRPMSFIPSTGSSERPKKPHEELLNEIEMKEQINIENLTNALESDDLNTTDFSIDADQPSTGKTTRPK